MDIKITKPSIKRVVAFKTDNVYLYHHHLRIKTTGAADHFTDALAVLSRFTFSPKTTIINDRRMIAVVYNNFIRFYRYDFGQKQWLQNSDVPDLKL